MKNTLIPVQNLATGETTNYIGITPRAAVRAAYAQQVKKDFKTFDYEKNYDSLVTETQLTVACGNFAAFINPALNNRQARIEWLEQNPDYFYKY